MCERNSPADIKVSEKGGQEVLQAPAQIPRQPAEQTLMRQAVPLQHMEAHSGADLHAQPRDDPTPEQVNARRRLWGAPRWSRLLPGPADPWREEPTPEQVCWQGL